MKPRPASLAQIQRWMQSVVMHPGGVAAAIESPQAREHLHVSLAEIGSVIEPSSRLASDERLGIYVDAYYLRLLECLGEEYAVMRTAVGEDLFGGLAFGYLQQHPSRSYTLHELGAKFPEFLATSRLHARDIPDGAPATWPEFVIELARYERMVREVFDGPGSERLPPFDTQALSASPPEALPKLRLEANPSLRLARFTHPVVEYWTAHHAGESPPVPEARECCALVYRVDYMVQRRELARLEFELLARLADRQSIEDALAALCEQQADDQQLSQAVSECFNAWMQWGLFVGFMLEG